MEMTNIVQIFKFTTLQMIWVGTNNFEFEKYINKICKALSNIDSEINFFYTTEFRFSLIKLLSKFNI